MASPRRTEEDLCFVIHPGEFYGGWLAYILSQPCPDTEAAKDGYKMAAETRSMGYEAIRETCAAGYIKVKRTAYRPAPAPPVSPPSEADVIPVTGTFREWMTTIQELNRLRGPESNRD